MASNCRRRDRPENLGPFFRGPELTRGEFRRLPILMAEDGPHVIFEMVELEVHVRAPLLLDIIQRWRRSLPDSFFGGRHRANVLFPGEFDHDQPDKRRHALLHDAEQPYGQVPVTYRAVAIRQSVSPRDESSSDGPTD